EDAGQEGRQIVCLQVQEKPVVVLVERVKDGVRTDEEGLVVREDTVERRAEARKLAGLEDDQALGGQSALLGIAQGLRRRFRLEAALDQIQVWDAVQVEALVVGLRASRRVAGAQRFERQPFLLFEEGI